MTKSKIENYRWFWYFEDTQGRALSKAFEKIEEAIAKSCIAFGNPIYEVEVYSNFILIRTAKRPIHTIKISEGRVWLSKEPLKKWYFFLDLSVKSISENEFNLVFEGAFTVSDKGELGFNPVSLQQSDFKTSDQMLIEYLFGLVKNYLSS